MPIKACTETAQKILNLVVAQLKKDNLYDDAMAESIKKIIPLVKKIASEANNACTGLTTTAIARAMAETEKETRDKEQFCKRKDHFTRFLLNPYEKFINNAESIRLTSGNIPRKIIPVIKKAVELMVPASYTEEGKSLSARLVGWYTHPEKEGGIDWEAIVEDWKVLENAMAAHRHDNLQIPWDEIHAAWESGLHDAQGLSRLKTMGELFEANEQIMRKFIEELSDAETLESGRAKLREIITDHIFQETGHEPEEEDRERICGDMIVVLSRALPGKK